MPGFLIHHQGEQQNFVYEDDATLDNIVDKSLVGFRIHPSTGNLTIEILGDGDKIYLPDDIIIDRNDYRALFWTKKSLDFSWTTERPGHLIMEVS